MQKLFTASRGHLSVPSKPPQATRKKSALFVTALCAVFSFYVQAEDTAEPTASDLSKGERLYKRDCVSCHGRRGEKPAFGQSAAVNGLKTDEIVTALRDRKAGRVEGAGNSVKKRLSDRDMQDVAAFLQTLKQSEKQ